MNALPRRLFAGWLAFSAAMLAQGAEQLSIEEELAKLERGEVPELEIAGARYRIAVFSYEDPDRTGLGNAFAALVSRHVLTATGVRSLGVLRYEGALGPAAPGELGYFDKIARLADSQKPVLSVWGVVRRTGNRIVVDTYAQLPADVIDTAFTWRLTLPERMNGGTLLARLGPDRFQVQRLELPATDAGDVRTAGETLDVLRREPRFDAPSITSLPQGKVYRILARERDWIRVTIEDGPAGWIPASTACGSACESLTDATAFLSGLVMAMERSGVPPADTLALDARVLSSELLAIAALNDGSIEAIEQGSLPALEQWREPSGEHGVKAIPGGAAVANLRAVSQMTLALKIAARDRGGSGSAAQVFNELAIEPQVVRSIAFQLAEASLDDPRNAELLGNLALLFEYAGEAGRADLARSLAQRRDTSPTE